MNKGKTNGEPKNNRREASTHRSQNVDNSQKREVNHQNNNNNNAEFNQNLKSQIIQILSTYYDNFLQQMEVIRNLPLSEVKIDHTRYIFNEINQISFKLFDNNIKPKKCNELFGYQMKLQKFLLEHYFSNNAKKLQKLELFITHSKPQRAVVILITDPTKQYVVLCQCGYNKNMYTFVKGAIEDGETAIQAARRELQEEVGIYMLLKKDMQTLNNSGLLFSYDQDQIFKEQTPFIIKSKIQLLYIYHVDLPITTQFHPLSSDEVKSCNFFPIHMLYSIDQSQQFASVLFKEPFNSAELLQDMFKHFGLII